MKNILQVRVLSDYEDKPFVLDRRVISKEKKEQIRGIKKFFRALLWPFLIYTWGSDASQHVKDI